MASSGQRGVEGRETGIIEKMRDLGLNKYEAESYIDLLKRSPSTAREISQRSSVPKQRIYDVLDELVAKGLVLITHSKPRLYSAVAPRRAVEMLLERARSLEVTANELLYGLEDIHHNHFRRTQQDKTVWVILRKEDLQEKLRESIRDASQSVVVISSRHRLLHQNYYDLLSAKSRGVEVTILTNRSDDPNLQEFSPLETDAELPNIFIFDDRRLAWIVTDEFMVYSVCPLCVHEVVKSCRMIVRKVMG